MHTSANISPIHVKKRLFLNAVCYIDSCIYSPTFQAIFDHMKPNIDLLKSSLNLIPKCHKLNHISFIMINMKHDPEWNPD